jgi:rhamnulokinase
MQHHPVQKGVRAMPQTSNYLAFDLGAESGRAVVGRYDGERVELATLHRFPNGAVEVLGSFYWDVLRLFDEMKAGLLLYGREHGSSLDGIGVDTWGVDFGLINEQDDLIGNPHNYRDPRTNDMMPAAFQRVPRAEIFEQTGIQFMQINTLYQLLSMRLSGDPSLDQASALLMMPDLLSFWLTGVKRNEFSIATTSQCYNPRTGDWARDLLTRLDLPTDVFQEVVQPGSVLGPLRQDIADELGLGSGVPVIAPGGHDTACAVAAVPAEGDDYAYISSGTWSLMGVEVREPVITDESLSFNFTNEGGVCDTYRLLKNIMGLWLVQQCRQTWAQAGEELSYGELTELAAEAPAFGPIVEPDASEFLSPGDMPSRIRAFCANTDQQQPETKGEIVRCALESLALKYRWVLEKLEIMLDRKLNVIHIVGGGSQNKLLCQLAADVTQRKVVAGPIEATATGNVLMQALAGGSLGSLEQLRQVVRNSFELETYTPESTAGWDEAYRRFLDIHAQTPEV